MTKHQAETRLEQIRQSIRDENLSYSELIELESLARYIDPGDIELLEAAGVPEFDEEEQYPLGYMQGRGAA